MADIVAQNQQNDDPGPIKFPLTWDKCPVCGDTHRVVNESLKKVLAQKNRKLGPEMTAAVIVYQSALTDGKETMVQFTVPVLTSYMDICLKCGTMYCVKVEYQMAMASNQPAPALPKNAKRGTGMNRGF